MAKKKATLLAVKDKKTFKFKTEAINVETELSLQDIETLTQVGEEIGERLAKYLKKCGVTKEEELTLAQQKTYEKKTKEEEKTLVKRDDLVLLLTGYEIEELEAHYMGIYGDIMGPIKFKNFKEKLVAAAFEFVNAP